jgi:hypothetical protein
MGWGFRRRERGAGGVVREAERLLEGRAVEGFIDRHEPVPAWTLISLLGHADRPSLASLAHPAGWPAPGGWSASMGRLAARLLDSARDERALLLLQRRALVPLELGLLGGALEPPRSPLELTDLVEGALERLRSPEL